MYFSLFDKLSKKEYSQADIEKVKEELIEKLFLNKSEAENSKVRT